MSEEEIRQLNGLLGANVRSNEMTIDEVISVLTQVTLALLIVFVMANVLFIGRAKAEVKFARQKVIDMGINLQHFYLSDINELSESVKKSCVDFWLVERSSGSIEHRHTP